MSPESILRFTLLSSPLKELRKASSWEELGMMRLNGDEQHEGKTWWLDVCDATEQDVNDVARCLSMHPLTVEDIVIQEPRQKIETFSNYYLIVVRTLSTIAENGRSEMAQDTTQSPTPITPSMLYILVFSHGTVTFSTSGCEHTSRVRSRISRLHDPSVLSSDWICYALLFVFCPSRHTTRSDK
jgi:Mg2+ and Co2+ transporter CorA